GVEEDLEHDRPVGTDFVIDANVGDECRVIAAEIVADVGAGVAAQSLEVGRAVEGEGFAVAGELLAVARVLFDRPPSAGGAGPRQIAQIGRCAQEPAALQGFSKITVAHLRSLHPRTKTYPMALQRLGSIRLACVVSGTAHS